jgi:hypothetical protein
MIEIALAAALQQARPVVFFSGNQLYEYCQREASLVCLGYVMGVADTIADASSAGDMTTRICPDRGVNPGQMMDVVVNFLRAHPERRHQAAPGIVAAALVEAFPCPSR